MSYLLTPVAFDLISPYKANIFLQCFLIQIPACLMFQFREQRLHRSSSFCKNFYGIALSWQFSFGLFCLLTCPLNFPLRFLRLLFVYLCWYSERSAFLFVRFICFFSSALGQSYLKLAFLAYFLNLFSSWLT